MAHDDIIERAERCWVFDRGLRRRVTEVLALNVSKYFRFFFFFFKTLNLRKLKGSDGSPLRGLRGAGFLT